jgi:hypothetical protein
MTLNLTHCTFLPLGSLTVSTWNRDIFPESLKAVGLLDSHYNFIQAASLVCRPKRGWAITAKLQTTSALSYMSVGGNSSTAIQW